MKNPLRITPNLAYRVRAIARIFTGKLTVAATVSLSMVTDVLLLIDVGNTRIPRDLVADLGTDPRMLDALIFFLKVIWSTSCVYVTAAPWYTLAINTLALIVTIATFTKWRRNRRNMQNGIQHDFDDVDDPFGK